MLPGSRRGRWARAARGPDGHSAPDGRPRHCGRPERVASHRTSDGQQARGPGRFLGQVMRTALGSQPGPRAGPATRKHGRHVPPTISKAKPLPRGDSRRGTRCVTSGPSSCWLSPTCGFAANLPKSLRRRQPRRRTSGLRDPGVPGCGVHLLTFINGAPVPVIGVPL